MRKLSLWSFFLYKLVVYDFYSQLYLKLMFPDKQYVYYTNTLSYPMYRSVSLALIQELKDECIFFLC